MKGKGQVNSFGENLRRLRYSKGFTQADVSRRSGGLSQSSVTQIEQGHKDPTLQTILKLARALEVPPSKLIDLDGWTTLNAADFENATSIEELDPISLRSAMTLIKHMKRLGLV